MNLKLAEIPNVICYVDNIQVTGSTREAHKKTGRSLTVTEKPCNPDGKEEVSFFCKMQLSTWAIQWMLILYILLGMFKSFLGLLHYNNRFICKLISMIHPLNNLLCDGAKCHWTSEYHQAELHGSI